MVDNMDIYQELDSPNLKGTFIYDYIQAKKKFDWQKIGTYSCEKLEKENSEFSNLSCRIVKLSKEYFQKILDDEKKDNEILDDDKEHNNKLYFDLANIYISEIQNVYLNPISYRLNQMEAKKSIKLAILSLALGIISLILGIVSITTTVFDNNEVKKQNSVNNQRYESPDSDDLSKNETSEDKTDKPPDQHSSLSE